MVLTNPFTVTKTSQYLIFGDQSWPVESLAQSLPEDTDVTVWIDGRGWVHNHQKGEARQHHKNRQTLSAMKAAQVAEMTEEQTVAIVGFEDPETSKKVAQALKIKNSSIKILQVGNRGLGAGAANPEARRFVAWSDLLSPGMDTEIYLLTIQERVRELRECLKDSEKIALLLQEDPDPDGLASALALRKVLGRNALSAPIVSFGTATRPENVAMARLLDIEILTIAPEELEKFAKVVMVDCQPSFFKGRQLRSDVIIDHHPRGEINQDSPVLFEEIREDLGAISTLLTQYLRATGGEVSQRLATALLYGIKSDTLMLNREVSEQDLEAFVYLYRRINGNILRRIERPELPLGYLEVLRKGLKYLKVANGVAILALDKIDREEWIPQAADFALQCEGVQWALGCGIYNEKVIISGRNAGYVEHCGDLFKDLFNVIGCAGGHRSMAKAIIPLSCWIETFGKQSLHPSKLPDVLMKLMALSIVRKPEKLFKD